MNEIKDVVIIGAGPAGLSSAIYTARARLKTLVLEKGAVGGQAILTDRIENYPGFPEGIVPFELVDRMKKQAEKFGAEIKIDEAKKINRNKNYWKITGYEGEYLAKAIIVATGSHYRKLGIPKEEKLTGKGISYCATCDGAFYTGKDVIVVGAGNTGITEALFLTRFCNRIYIIEILSKIMAEKILQERALKNKKIEIFLESELKEIIGQDKVEGAIIRNVSTGKIFKLKVDGIFISIGMVPNSEFVKGLLELDKQGRIKVNAEMETSQKGIFAAGDVASLCPNQIATAVGSGVTAALSVEKYLEELRET
ncbi:thioredoxin-disulfide reductase [SCandidatus Aminicenantes bacterium Aminicenantia_JdfR_composite]|jgi:thioredoxin reductase (NADPH)|nr:thioredoxin-disulfide reductase [SCandidatus Aminicenantes bacterium Aminicenantia_JdfR_composite]MCP2596854.1 thioredoxin-disulfide reductase [Candidatus Aminicenantes bacterium AC-335-G13]MCP2598658.1 thioredoxin-disulfide reductase [Candidatus Aminicenantes bacterium AC-335-L06]MCP2605534.1 thioredoxin-disulfide reductase [Candidatus Aminicenantes bacterium AC-335-O07]MCP2606539.1 thioredoxin-disulfide reductase [Candidatus Aminicenantes bacterium AC-708-I09]